jgi:hypothetical protein
MCDFRAPERRKTLWCAVWFGYDGSHGAALTGLLYTRLRTSDLVHQVVGYNRDLRYTKTSGIRRTLFNLRGRGGRKKIV